MTVIVGTKGKNVKIDFPTEESGLPIETVFLCFQICSLDKTRFTAKPSGQLSEAKMLEVEATVRFV